VDFPDGYLKTTLGAFYDSRGAMLCDAYQAANLAGGTPCARPEDCEINPSNPREVFISMTDGAPGSDGYPDSRIFVVAKYSAAVDAVQHSGSLHKIVEDSADGTEPLFTGRAVQGGAEDGAGFAQVDNLAFDQVRPWAVNDISNSSTTASPAAYADSQLIDHKLTGIAQHRRRVRQQHCSAPSADRPGRAHRDRTAARFTASTAGAPYHPSASWKDRRSVPACPTAAASSCSTAVSSRRLRKMSRGSNWPRVEALAARPARGDRHHPRNRR
jgi:hypothetical protein